MRLRLFEILEEAREKRERLLEASNIYISKDQESWWYLQGYYDLIKREDVAWKDRDAKILAAFDLGVMDREGETSDHE